MITIPRDSEAWKRLEEAVTNPDTYKVSLAVREPGENHPGFILIKRNEGMWTYPLKVEDVNS